MRKAKHIPWTELLMLAADLLFKKKQTVQIHESTICRLAGNIATGKKGKSQEGLAQEAKKRLRCKLRPTRALKACVG